MCMSLKRTSSCDFVLNLGFLSVEIQQKGANLKAFRAICEFLLIFKLKLNILGYNFILQSQNLRKVAKRACGWAQKGYASKGQNLPQRDRWVSG